MILKDYAILVVIEVFNVKVTTKYYYELCIGANIANVFLKQNKIVFQFIIIILIFFVLFDYSLNFKEKRIKSKNFV